MDTIGAGLLKELLVAGSEALEAKKEHINELNVFPVPDGDTGTNMTMTVESAVKEINALEDDTMESLCKAISSGSLRGARGNSGVILSQLMRGFAKTVRKYKEIDKGVIAESFENAVNTAYKAVMKPKEGTILTVAKAGSDMAIYLSDSDIDIVTYMEAIIEHMENVLAQTPEMLPVLKEAGVVDSGGAGLVTLLKGAFSLLAERVPRPAGAKKPDVSNMKKKKAQPKKPEPAKKQEPAKKPEAAKKPAARMGTEKKTYGQPSSKADISTADIKFAYCTEFIIELDKEFGAAKEEELKLFLESIGDSIVVVSDDDVVKAHVHTNMPGIVLQKALTYGPLTKIKIDNMRKEHNEVIIKEASLKAEREERGEDAALSDTGQDIEAGEPAEAVPEETEAEAAPVPEETEVEAAPVLDETEPEEAEAEAAPEEVEAEAAPAPDETEPAKPTGFITVSAGEGLSEIFIGLGADVIIEGGQTMNPSTEDLLNAIDSINAKTIFIMPNNSNIILAAEQAKGLCEDKKIIVIPSKTIPQGIMAMLSYIPSKSVEENEKAMLSEMKTVKSGSVTYSIRDTVIQGREIKQGDIMGIQDDMIITTGAQVMATTVELIGKLIDEESELVTLYYGKDTTEDEANLIAGSVSEKYPDVEVEVHYGGQPVYYYYLSVE